MNIHPVVQQAMDIPSANHRDPWFPILFSKLLQDVKMIFGTKEATSFIYPGTGTGGWESAIQNTLSPGDKVRQGGGQACRVLADGQAGLRFRVKGVCHAKHPCERLWPLPLTGAVVV